MTIRAQGEGSMILWRWEKGVSNFFYKTGIFNVIYGQFFYKTGIFNVIYGRPPLQNIMTKMKLHFFRICRTRRSTGTSPASCAPSAARPSSTSSSGPRPIVSTAGPATMPSLRPDATAAMMSSELVNLLAFFWFASSFLGNRKILLNPYIQFTIK